MTALNLNEQQTRELAAALKKLLGDLSYEISNTDNKTFRDQVKQRRDLLKQIADALPAAA